MGESFNWENFKLEMEWLANAAMERQLNSDEFTLGEDTSVLTHWVETQKRDIWFAEENLNIKRWHLNLMLAELQRRKSDNFIWKSRPWESD